MIIETVHHPTWEGITCSLDAAAEKNLQKEVQVTSRLLDHVFGSL